MTRQQRKKELKANIQATASISIYLYIIIVFLLELFK